MAAPTRILPITLAITGPVAAQAPLRLGIPTASAAATRRGTRHTRPEAAASRTWRALAAPDSSTASRRINSLWRSSFFGCNSAAYMLSGANFHPPIALSLNAFAMGENCPLFVQDHTQKRVVNLDPAVVVNKA